MTHDVSRSRTSWKLTTTPLTTFAMSCILVIYGAPANTASPLSRSVSWWYDVSEDPSTDRNNIDTIRNHTDVFTRVMPYNAKLKLDGNVSEWWGHDEDIDAWNKPLQGMNIPVLPYLIDIDNATQMHLVYKNASAFIADAVAIAVHYNFQGWFIDYEDEYPPDTSANKTQALSAFLTQLGNALHAKNMKLCICVASWSRLLSDYKTLASSRGVDELQLMSTYANPSHSMEIVRSYFDKIQSGAGDLNKAGVGMGIYYDGRNGYTREWTATSARTFIKDVVVGQGGHALDIFRLLKDGPSNHDWPHEEFWWDVLSDFVHKRI